jgi:hypothetical protein
MAASNPEMAPLRSGSFRSTVMEWIRFHRVNTWIFCYETSEQGSPLQMRYERLLREFVAAKNLMLGLRVQANAALYRGIEARRASTELDEEIQRCCNRA